MPALYGASVDGVEGILTTQVFDDTTRPTRHQVEGFVATVSGLVRAAVGSLQWLDADRRTEVEQAARGIVEIGAASLADAAGHPHAAGPDERSFSDNLWSRYKSELERLRKGLEEEKAGSGGVDAPARPAVSGPPPLFRRGARY